MEIKYNTTREAIDALCDKLARKEASRQDFEDLVDTAKKCAVFNDDCRYVKLFIPYKNQYTENLYARSFDGVPMSESLSDRLTEITVEVLAKRPPFAIFFSYCVEKREDGNYLAFDVEDSQYAGGTYAYFSLAKHVIQGFKHLGVEISVDEWLEKFPLQYYTAVRNREKISPEITSITRYLEDENRGEYWAKVMTEKEMSVVSETIFFYPSNYRFTGLIAGRDIDLNKYSTGYISRWNPTSEFIQAPRYEYLEQVEEEKANGVRSKEEIIKLENELRNILK